MKLFTKLRDKPEHKILKMRKFYSVFSWLFYFMGWVFAAVIPLLIVVNLPRDPYTLVLSTEKFLPAVEAYYLFALLIKMVQALFSFVAAIAMFGSSLWFEYTVHRYDLELRLREIEGKLK